MEISYEHENKLLKNILKKLGEEISDSLSENKNKLIKKAIKADISSEKSKFHPTKFKGEEVKYLEYIFKNIGSLMNDEVKAENNAKIYEKYKDPKLLDINTFATDNEFFYKKIKKGNEKENELLQKILEKIGVKNIPKSVKDKRIYLKKNNV